MKKHARFLQIERGAPDEAPESESADRARITAVIAAAPMSAEAERIELAEEAPAGDGRPPDGSARAERMLDAPAIEGSVDLALDVAKPEGQPFVRCARCGADSTIHATTCQHCAARLDTAEQRAWNDRVWATRLRQNDEERAALDEMAAARYRDTKSAVRPLPDPGMKPPPELLAAPEEDNGPILLDALRALQKPSWRWAAGATAAGLPLLLVTLGGPLLGKVGWILVVLLLLSLLPASVGRRLFEHWVEMRRRR